LVASPEGDVVVDPEGDVVVELDGDREGSVGLVDGDAAGGRSDGRSPVRVFGDSVQATARVVTRASRPKPLTSFFM
jgi:hypothetical protein